MKVIIPCAGYGTRMNMSIDRSKEMLINPNTGNTLIDDTLLALKRCFYEPHIITRKEKTDLINHLIDKNISFQIIEPEGEWSNTVLKSAPFWDDDNLLVLPDTTWLPKQTPIHDITNGLLLGNNAVFALHFVDNISKWGSIDDYFVTEKSDCNFCGFAWGLIGFKYEYGKILFEAMKHKNKPLKLENVGFTFLEEFKDLTRTGKIE